jgi:hypothetical protein
MKAAGSLLLFLLAAQEPACDHGARGASKPVDLASVGRAHVLAARAFTILVEGAAPAPPARFDSGLPHCRSRAIRRVRVDRLPEGMKPLHFAPAGTPPPEGALPVATSARSISETLLPAGSELAARFGVRCAPTLVKPVSREEVELVEGE